MSIYTVTVVDEDSVVVDSYTVSTVIDFDTEDIDAEENYDYYLSKGWSEDLNRLAESITRRINYLESQKGGTTK